MTVSISNRKKWQDILHKQRIANVEYWLDTLEQSKEPAKLVVDDYGNLLRALESTLDSPDTFDLAYRLVQLLYPFVFGYADWERWLSYLNKAVSMSQALNRESEYTLLLEQTAKILYYTGNLEQAKNLFIKVAEKHHDLKDWDSYSHTLTRLGMIYDSQGEMDKGIQLCQKALVIAQAVGVEYAIGDAYLTLSHIYIRARNLEAALEAAQQAHQAYQKLDKLVSGTALSNLVLIWAELGNWQKVNEISEELIQNSMATQNIRALSKLKNSLGIAAFNQNNYKTAESLWQEAYRLHSQIHEPTELAHLYNNLGMVYTKMEEWGEAQEMLYKAIEAFSNLGDKYHWANSLDNIADLYEAKGDMATCQHVLEKAIDGLAHINQPPQHCQELLKNMRQRLQTLTETRGTI